MVVQQAFDRKIGRAEKHLIDLDRLIKKFVDRHPYTVTKVVEGKRQQEVWRLTFTEQPDARTSLVAGDFLYNLRAGMDYLIGALVPARYRSNVMFPIVREPVWELPYVEGENPERTRNRARWETVTRGMDAGAVAIIEAIQPLDRDATPDTWNTLDILNRLSNKDRHRELVAHGSGLTHVKGNLTLRDGRRMDTLVENPGGNLLDGTEVYSANGAVDVKLSGTPVVVIEMPPLSLNVPGGLIRIPRDFHRVFSAVRDEIVAPLRPFTRSE